MNYACRIKWPFGPVNALFTTRQVSSVTAVVRFPPTVKLKASSDPAKTLREGMQLKLICQAEGNPTKFRYKWTVDGDSGELVRIIHFPSWSLLGRSSLWSAEESVFLIPSLTREMLNMVVACTVSNSEGSGTDTIKIDVACEYQEFCHNLNLEAWKPYESLTCKKLED